MLEPGGTPGELRGKQALGQKTQLLGGNKTCDRSCEAESKIRLSPESGDWIFWKGTEGEKALVQFQMNRKYLSVTKGRIEVSVQMTIKPLYPYSGLKAVFLKIYCKTIPTEDIKCPGWGNFRSALEERVSMEEGREGGEKNTTLKNKGSL